MSDDQGEEDLREPSKEMVAPNAAVELPDLFRWVTREFEKSHKKPIDRLRLLRRSLDGSGVHVYSWTDEDFQAGPQSLFEDLYEKAMNEARLQPGRVSFLLQIAYKDRTKHEDISQPFEMQGSARRDGEDAFGGEPASPKGLIAQTQRHLEAVMRMALVTTREVTQNLQRQNEEKDRQISNLLGLHIQVLDLHSKLKDRDFERELERKDKEAMRNLKTGLLEEGIKKIPEVIEMFARPKQAEAFIGQMTALFDMLGEDGINRMIQGLITPDPVTGQISPENQQKAMALTQMIGQLLEAREAAAKKKEQP